MSERPETEGKKDDAKPAEEDRGFLGADSITFWLPDGSAVQVDSDSALWKDTDGRVWQWTGVTDGDRGQWEDVENGEHTFGPKVDFLFPR